jgi:hypothetical protein
MRARLHGWRLPTSLLNITHCRCLHYCVGDGINPARSNSSSRHDLSTMYPGVKSIVWRSDAILQVGLDEYRSEARISAGPRSTRNLFIWYQWLSWDKLFLWTLLPCIICTIMQHFFLHHLISLPTHCYIAIQEGNSLIWTPIPLLWREKHYHASDW